MGLNDVVALPPPLIAQLGTVLGHLERKLSAEADIAELDKDDARAHADTHRIYTYFDAMEWEPVREAVETLGAWARRDSEKDMTILLNSPGGYCVEGYALYDWLREMRRRHRFDVEIVGLGQVSSMASVVIQAATHRVMHRNAWMLIHETMSMGPPPDGYFDAKLSVQEEELKQTRRLELQGTRILASRSNLTMAEIKERTEKRDWWLTAREALSVGLIDEVR